ncbi:MAG TPA: hypothetical protein PK264_22730 [Hyphomicrobiaceae bacterium]|nr:hypothetical protein [Hyphomicrobiaceae bacterium]
MAAGFATTLTLFGLAATFTSGLTFAGAGFPTGFTAFAGGVFDLGAALTTEFVDGFALAFDGLAVGFDFFT